MSLFLRHTRAVELYTASIEMSVKNKTVSQMNLSPRVLLKMYSICCMLAYGCWLLAVSFSVEGKG